MYKTIALVDADSIAYQAGWCNTLFDMRTCIDNKIASIKENTKAVRLEVYLEEWREKKGIFRRDIFQDSNGFVTKPGYKGNRKVANKKPLLLDSAREYLVKRWNGTAIIVFESEDTVIRRAYEEIEKGNEPIICFIDKDLLQHPLVYYNYNTKQMVTLTYDEAILNRYRQVCSGDSTDNIPGIPGIGKRRAFNAIRNAESALQDAINMYKAHDLPYQYFVEQYNLIYIRKENHTGVIMPVTKGEYNEA